MRVLNQLLEDILNSGGHRQINPGIKEPGMDFLDDWQAFFASRLEADGATLHE